MAVSPGALDAPPLSEPELGRLGDWLREALDARAVRIERCARLGGGAIQENMALDLAVFGGWREGRHELVLRTDAPSGLAVSRSRAQEYRILEVAHQAGVLAPEPFLLCEGAEPLGRSFYLMARAAGEARAARLVRDPAVRARGEAIAARLGGELARLHAVVPPVPGLDFIEVPEKLPMLVRIGELRAHLDRMSEAQPVLEWGLRWLERHAPPQGGLCLVHGDLRTGNYMVADGDVTAILDWEFAGFGDPLEDLGWLLARCWRFGAVEREAGGIGSRAALLDAYEAASGRALPRGHIVHWELLATIRWAVVALMQAQRHFSGNEPSLELALTGTLVPALEQDVLDYVGALEREQTA
ncbi:phosphotransferase family protein [Geminicoccaceae bacterium 1502E]|nr:phosphotransferase family protein [Geminicoccaceae bacterium 1502E]